MNLKEDILIIAAHPDDEVLGVGATIAKKVQEGHYVSVIILATGITGRHPHGAWSSKIGDETDVLKKEAEEAAFVLGVENLYFLDFPDNRLDTIPKMDIALRIKEQVEIIKSKSVYIHHSGDYNWNHGIAFDASLMACRPNVGDFFPKKIYSYEVLSSTERSFQNSYHTFMPNVFEDIKNTVEIKKKALKCYKTELRTYPHPRSPEAIEYLARKRNNEVGLFHAEAFQLIREINDENTSCQG